jgi:hypothetical protein
LGECYQFWHHQEILQHHLHTTFGSGDRCQHWHRLQLCPIILLAWGLAAIIDVNFSYASPYPQLERFTVRFSIVIDYFISAITFGLGAHRLLRQ